MRSTKGSAGTGFSGACVTWSDMQVILKFGSPRGPEWHAGGTGKVLTSLENGQCSLICPAVTTSSAIVAQGRLFVGRRWPTTLCSEGGEWVWLAGSQSRPGQSKRLSAIVRLEEHRREPSLLRRSVASLSTTARPAACFPGHATATVAVRGRVFTLAHKHLTEYLPYPSAAVARRGGIRTHHRLAVNNGSAPATQSSLACMSAACGSWAARLGFLVGRPRPALTQRGVQSPHALTSSRCTILDCSQSPEDAAIPTLRHALAQEYWHLFGTKGQASLEPPQGPIC
jgi:hypothetical protein